eukprot:s386_g24.t1
MFDGETECVIDHIAIPSSWRSACVYSSVIQDFDLATATLDHKVVALQLEWHDIVWQQGKSHATGYHRPPLPYGHHQDLDGRIAAIEPLPPHAVHKPYIDDTVWALREMKNGLVKRLKDARQRKAHHFLAGCFYLWRQTLREPFAEEPAQISEDIQYLAVRFFQHMEGGERMSFEDLRRQLIQELRSFQSSSLRVFADHLPSLTDLEMALRRVPQGRACGPDGIPGELCRHHASTLAKQLYPHLAKIVLHGNEFLGFKSGRLTPAYKGRGPTNRCSSYRSLLVSSHVGKTLHRAIRQKHADIERWLQRQQTGGRRKIPVQLAVLQKVERFVREHDINATFQGQEFLPLFGCQACTETWFRFVGPNWMDDLALVIHADHSDQLVSQMGCVTGYLLDVCTHHCMSPNLSRGKTEIALTFRGPGSRNAKTRFYGPTAPLQLPIVCEHEIKMVQLVTRYRHLGRVSHHSGDQHAEIKQRVVIAHRALSQHSRVLFRNPLISLQKRAELFVMLVLVRAGLSSPEELLDRRDSGTLSPWCRLACRTCGRFLLVIIFGEDFWNKICCGCGLNFIMPPVFLIQRTTMNTGCSWCRTAQAIGSEELDARDNMQLANVNASIKYANFIAKQLTCAKSINVSLRYDICLTSPLVAVDLDDDLYSFLVDELDQRHGVAIFQQKVLDFSTAAPISWTTWRRTVIFFMDSLDDADAQFFEFDMAKMRLALEALSTPSTWSFLGEAFRQVPDLDLPSLEAQCRDLEQHLRRQAFAVAPRAFGKHRLLLHAFSGRRRVGDVQFFLDGLAASQNDFILRVISFDLINDPVLGDAMSLQTRHFWLQAIRKNHVIAFLGGPPCESWSCAREAGNDDEATTDQPLFPAPEHGGPRPIRTLDDLSGLPSVSLRELAQLYFGNELLCFSLQAIMELIVVDGCAILEHPAEPLHRPSAASIWKLPIVRTLAQCPGMQILRFSQGLLGSALANPQTY